MSLCSKVYPSHTEAAKVPISCALMKFTLRMEKDDDLDRKLDFWSHWIAANGYIQVDVSNVNSEVICEGFIFAKLC